MTYFIITFAVFFVISIFGLIAAGYEKKDKDQSHMKNSKNQNHKKQNSKEKDEVFGDYDDLWDGFDKK